MIKKGKLLGEMYLKEGLSQNVIEYSQKLDIPIVKQQRLLLEKHLHNINNKQKNRAF